TSDADNAPVSVTEAMACGLCVVTTDAGGLRDLVADGDDALVVPRGSAPEMAAAVARLLADRALAARLSSNARRRAEALDWSRLLPEWEELLRGSARTP
ncbi:MAG TPA: glycosyltransferase family 4 protein, partial [Thermoanaerobaculia bacterium]